MSLINASILLFDIEGFSNLPGVAARRAQMEALQRLQVDAARFFMPFGDPWSKWKLHGTGDGYYAVLDGLGSQVALQHLLELESAVERYNEAAGRNLPIRIRAVLGHGDVHDQGGQLVSDEFIELARFIDDGAFKAFAKTQTKPCTIGCTGLFHHHLEAELNRKVEFAELKNLPWKRWRVVDKHGHTHDGWVAASEWGETAQ